MEDYRNMERCSGEPCCVFAERICADNEKEILKMEKDRKEKVMADEMVDDLTYLAELIDFTGIVSCLAVRGTLSERMTDKLTDSMQGWQMKCWKNGRTIRIRQNNRYKTEKGMVKVAGA